MGFDGNMGTMIEDAHLDDSLYVKNPDQLLETDKGDTEKPMDVDFGQTKDGQFPDNMSDFGKSNCNRTNLILKLQHNDILY